LFGIINRPAVEGKIMKGEVEILVRGRRQVRTATATIAMRIREMLDYQPHRRRTSIYLALEIVFIFVTCGLARGIQSLE